MCTKRTLGTRKACLYGPVDGTLAAQRVKSWVVCAILHMRLERSVYIWGKRGDHARGRTGAARTIHDHRTVTREFYEHLLPGQTAQERSFAEEAKYSSYYDRGQRSLPGPCKTTEEAQEP